MLCFSLLLSSPSQIHKHYSIFCTSHNLRTIVTKVQAAVTKILEVEEVGAMLTSYTACGYGNQMELAGVTEFESL